MSTLKKIGMFLIKIVLSVANIILLLIIVLNLGVLLSTSVLKADYPSLLDYTYYIANENISKFGITSGDLVLIDMRIMVDKDDIVMYKNNSGYHIEKVKEVEKEITLTNEEVIPKDQVIGKQIQNLNGIGTILETLLKPITLVIAIILLTVTSIIQNHLNKKTKKDNPKPNFNQTW